MTSILFLCTGNSARSLLAEALANERFGDRLTACSAGSRPRGTPHRLTLVTLERNGIDASGLESKSWITLRDRRFDLVITLCADAAAEPCPTFPGAPARAHWGLPDPPAAEDPPDAFQRVFDALRDALARFAADDEPDLAVRAEHAARVLSRHFERP